MKTLHYSIHIHAPKEKVWSTMLEDATYREWTKSFCEGSYYKGDWSQGSKILFLGPDPKTGVEGGMLSRIKENRLYEYVSIEHYGEIHDGAEKPYDEGKVSYENYTFIDKDGGTELLIEMTDVPDEYSAMFDDSWPKSLEVLKGLAER